MKDRKIWLLPEQGNLYKTNLHCHSTVSDGAYTPAQLKEMYMAQGYSAIAYTDHRVCVPHPELTDENFVALSGLEIAFGIGKTTSVHVCGIAREPGAQLLIENEPLDHMDKLNAGICRLKQENYITTLNHPRWSGIALSDIPAVGNVENIEVVNGFEKVQDGYGESDAIFELELRRGRRVCPLATDDSHRESKLEYFQGFTVIKAEELTYGALIEGLDTGAFYASTGPMFRNLWLEGDVLHVQCSPVCGVYVHGKRYSHRAAVIDGSDTITETQIDLGKTFTDSEYFFVQLVDTKGKRAWSCPHWR